MSRIFDCTVLGSDPRSGSDRRSIIPNPIPIPNPNPNPSRSEPDNFSFNSLLSFRSPIWTYNYPFRFDVILKWRSWRHFTQDNSAIWWVKTKRLSRVFAVAHASSWPIVHSYLFSYNIQRTCYIGYSESLSNRCLSLPRSRTAISLLHDIVVAVGGVGGLSPTLSHRKDTVQWASCCKIKIIITDAGRRSMFHSRRRWTAASICGSLCIFGSLSHWDWATVCLRRIVVWLR